MNKLSEKEKELLDLIVKIRKQGVDKYLSELGISEKDMKFYQELQQAIKRGEELHPGPYSIQQWLKDLENEWWEVKQEIYNLCFQDENNLESELIDLMVVAIRIIKFRREKKAEYKAAQEYDP